MNRRFLFCILSLLLLGGSIGHACLWDRDTVQDEIEQMQSEGFDVDLVLDTIIGKIPHYPDLYYKMRLERVAAELEESPEALELYDDAGVAADRIGDAATAFEMMALKKDKLDLLADEINADRVQNHWYRYHANLGTFYMHRWMRNGKDFNEMADVELARTHITQALQFNQEAHFGREKYQLAFIEWVLEIPVFISTIQRGEKMGFSNFLNVTAYPQFESLSDELASEHINGIIGLIRLGNAWESYDILETLRLLLAHQRQGALATLIGYRLSFDPRPLLQSITLKSQLVAFGEIPAEWHPPHIGYSNYTPTDVLAFQSKVLLNYGRGWSSYRTRYILANLRKGRHPDTDPGFWSEYDPPAFEGYDFITEHWMKYQSMQESDRDNYRTGLKSLLALPFLFFPLLYISFRFLRRRRAA